MKSRIKVTNIGAMCALAALQFGVARSEPTTAPGSDLQEIVVTARQREESLKDVPIAVTAISSDSLKDKQIYSVKDIAAYAPGLNINSDSVGRAFVSIRGVGTTLIDTVQPGVGIFIDGIYEPNTSYLVSPLVDVARVEVLRGPQGTLFGNNTLGGAINVITRQPTNKVEGHVDTAYAGADNFKSVSGSISGPIIDDVLQIRIGAAYHSQDGFQRNILAGGYQNPLSQMTFNATIRYKPADWAQLTMNANYDRVTGGSVPYLWSNGPTDYTLDGSTNSLNRTTISYKGANIKGEFDARSINTKITAVAAYTQRPATSFSDGDFGPIDFLRSTNDSLITNQSGELRFDTTWSDSLSSLIGVFESKYVTNAASTTLIVPFGLTVPASDHADNKSDAIFATVFFKLNSTLDLAVGARYDHQKLTDTLASTAGDYSASKFQPRVTLTKRWDPDFMTYGSIARGVRGGGQNGPGAPNLIYKGDSVWTYELGAKFSALERRLEVNTAVFYNNYSDFIGQNALAPSTTGAGFVAVNLNSGKVKSYGVEGEASWRVTDNWAINAGLTLLHARITDARQFLAVTGYALPGDHILFVPDWNADLGTNYKIPIGSADTIVLDGTLVAKGSRSGSSLDASVVPQLSAYYLTNASIAWKHDSFELAAFATNLFNEKYIESYIDKSALARAGLPPPLVNNLSLQGERRRIGVRASFKF